MKNLNCTNIALAQTLPTKVIQFGGGNFLRAFVDWAIQLMNEKSDFGAGVAVIKPTKNGNYDLLKNQDGLFHVILKGFYKGKDVNESKLITCVNQVINPYENWQDYIQLAENPDIRFVISNTTESGIVFEPEVWDENKSPKSFPAKLTAFLYHRYQFFQGDADKGMVILPCELINHNAEELKKIILQYTRLSQLDIGFIKWLENHNVFCNTLVDRIVPGYPKNNAVQIQNEIGFEDDLLVESEPYFLWVIEAPLHVRDEFPADKAGLNVIFTEDLQVYRTLKVRILNGAHTAMVPVALLWGIDTVKETIEHEKVGKFIHNAIFEEIIPVLELPQNELEQFANDVLDRFRNPFIKHYLSSIALNSFSKFETRVLPTIFDYQRLKGKLPKHLIFSFASLILFYKKEYGGREMPINDEPKVVKTLQQAWKQYDGTQESIEKVIDIAFGLEDIWKQNLNGHKALRNAVVTQLAEILSEGFQKTLGENQLIHLNL